MAETNQALRFDVTSRAVHLKFDGFLPPVESANSRLARQFPAGWALLFSHRLLPVSGSTLDSDEAIEILFHSNSYSESTPKTVQSGAKTQPSKSA
jgi:hypothetical protein